ncbi:hypothetical protein [Spongiactinospora sp. 9N601]|uniref:hypothetical protein n=1 Tax=Spongiactinospora sp. 9N601 TaxID=3375149 RepID=UPI0037910E7D
MRAYVLRFGPYSAAPDRRTAVAVVADVVACAGGVTALLDGPALIWAVRRYGTVSS